MDSTEYTQKPSSPKLSTEYFRLSEEKIQLYLLNPIPRFKMCEGRWEGEKKIRKEGRRKEEIHLFSYTSGHFKRKNTSIKWQQA